MDYRLFRQLISNKGTEEKQELTQLQEFVREYPYCQTGHLLLAKSMHLHDHVGYEQQLKRTAACVPDRTVLFNLIHSIQAFASDSPLQLEDVSPFKTEEQPLPIFVDHSHRRHTHSLWQCPPPRQNHHSLDPKKVQLAL